MPTVDAVVECPVRDSFRVQQVAGLFDVSVGEKVRHHFWVEVPGLSDPWQIGAIVGPSGSGKTTVARSAFGQFFYEPAAWPEGHAVIDGFGDLPIKKVTHALTAVGFSTPPSWVKPYAVLSTGEKFRCDLARALLSDNEAVVFDEFTSVVDRTVAKIAAAAVGGAIRKGHLAKRFVAVSCHYDILQWLQPQWVVDMATCRLSRRRLWRPDIDLEVFRCRNATWELFAPHHYLSAELHHSAECYLATWSGRPVAFVAVLPMTGKRNYRRISRIVVLPDFQGVGIGSRVLDGVCDLYHRRRQKMGITTGHPGMIRHLCRSPRWRLGKHYPLGNVGKHRGFRKAAPRDRGSLGRCVVAFRYCSRDGATPQSSAGTQTRP